MKLRTKIAVGATLGAAGITAGGMAFAYFTSSGSGNGSGVVGSAANWGVSVSNTASGTIYPGQGSETLAYTVTNNGSGNQELQSLAVAVTADSSTPANVFQYSTSNQTYSSVSGCQASWFTAAVDQPSPGVDLAPGKTVTGLITVTMADATANQNLCEGITGPEVTLTAG
jgi:hypothetical protein